MHPSFAQRVTALEGLRARARQATAEFYQKPGVQPPPLAPLKLEKLLTGLFEPLITHEHKDQNILSAKHLMRESNCAA